jgi:hypothetical protein
MSAGRQQQAYLPDWGKDLIEVIEIAKQGYKVHRRAPERKWFGNHRVSHLPSPAENPASVEFT